MPLPLKAQLQQIAAAGYAAPDDTDPFALALQMMDQIGATDSELRDDLIYATFFHWIYRQKLFSHAQLQQLLDTALDDRHLFFGLGEQNTDSVFTRTFSALLLALVLNAHRETPFLSAEAVKTSHARMVAYLDQEKDLRGYVDVKGWAHAVAHGSDALDELALCPELDAADLRSILAVAMEKMCQGEAPYIYQEDERMTNAVASVISRGRDQAGRDGLSDAEIEAWVGLFAERSQAAARAPENFSRLNIRNFLHCLYFRLLEQKSGKANLMVTLQETLARCQA